MKTILIVDDDPDILTTMTCLLQALLFKKNMDVIILVALSGEEALQVIHRQQVELLFTDYNMPGINGFQLITRIHSKPYMRKVLMSSDYLLIDQLIGVARDKIDAVLKKPFNINKIKRLLETLL